MPPTPPAAKAVTKWAKAAAYATEARNQAIVTARAEGLTLRDIAQAAGMTHPGVIRILKKAARGNH